MTVDDFFKRYPNAPGVVKVGTDLYLVHRIGAARDHARRHGLEVEEIPNPALVEEAEAAKAEEAKAPAKEKASKPAAKSKSKSSKK